MVTCNALPYASRLVRLAYRVMRDVGARARVRVRPLELKILTGVDFRFDVYNDHNPNLTPTTGVAKN